jgi:hypothetical protein
LASGGLIAPVAPHRSFHPNELFVQFSIDKTPLIIPFMLLSQNWGMRDKILPLRNVTSSVIMRPDRHLIILVSKHIILVSKHCTNTQTFH